MSLVAQENRNGRTDSVAQSLGGDYPNASCKQLQFRTRGKQMRRLSILAQVANLNLTRRADGVREECLDVIRTNCQLRRDKQ